MEFVIIFIRSANHSSCCLTLAILPQIFYIGQSVDGKSVDAVPMDVKYVDHESGVVRQYIDDTIPTVTH